MLEKRIIKGAWSSHLLNSIYYTKNQNQGDSAICDFPSPIPQLHWMSNLKNLQNICIHLKANTCSIVSSILEQAYMYTNILVLGKLLQNADKLGQFSRFTTEFSSAQSWSKPFISLRLQMIYIIFNMQLQRTQYLVLLSEGQWPPLDVQWQQLYTLVQFFQSDR